MNRSVKKFFFGLGIVLCWLSQCYGLEVSIPAMNAKPGQTIDIPVMIDDVENLAGIKLVMKYDVNILKFQKAEKTSSASSLMHIVNDKNPGALIVVMAGARGIKGKGFSILTMTFEIQKEIKSNQTTSIEITEAQLMSDQLKNLTYTIKVNPIAIEL